MGFLFYCKHLSTRQKLFKPDRPFKSYRKKKCANSKTDDLLHAYLHLIRTTLCWATCIK